MRVLWHSNAPWAPTGYGQQTATFAPRIRDAGHDVAISAFWGLGGSPQSWDGMRVYGSDEQYGNLYLPNVAKHWGEGEPVLVITLTDVWVLKTPQIAELNLAAWVPVDHDPIPPEVAHFFDWSGAKPIAMSRFGERQLRDRGLDPFYVPHGIDTTVFQPRPQARSDIRELLGIPEDAFVVGMVAANKGNGAVHRKSFPQVFEAFSRLQREHDDAYLYLHTEMLGRFSGLDLRELIVAFDIPPDRVRHTPPWAYELGVKPEDLAGLYSAMDVLANPALGEGFGIPIIEAQACGVPVIVTDWTAMTELCGAGWLVDGDRLWDTGQHSFFKCPSVASIVDALGQAYEHRGDEDLAVKAREFAVGYDADRVMEEHWRPVLDALTAVEVVKPAEVEPAEVFERVPNRAERRAMRRAA